MAGEGNFPKADGDTFFETDIHYAGAIVVIEAGENVTAGKAGYIHLTDGKGYLGDTGTADDIRSTGIFLQTKTSGQDVYMMTRGVYLTSGLTADEDYYLGSAGAISTTRSAIRIGNALSTTELFVNIVQDDRDVVGTVKAYLKSFTGLPSNNLSAFWVECNGQALSDAESPFNGQTIPDLNGSSGTERFLRGQTTSGGTGGSETHTHGLTKADDAAGDDTWFVTAISATSTLPTYYEVVWIMKIK